MSGGRLAGVVAVAILIGLVAIAAPRQREARYACAVVARDGRGVIVRSAAARRCFLRLTGFPAGRLGYVVDHVIPLECGGDEVPSNMQWQTIADAKAKDRTERDCAGFWAGRR